MEIKHSKSEGSPAFDKIEGYTLEVFPSLEELETRMETIRASYSTEAYGFVREKGAEFGFYYTVGDSEISSELPSGENNSWHCHPNSVSHEAIIEANNIPDDLPEDLKHLAQGVLTSYECIDEANPIKPSLIDLINIVDHQREVDRISLPVCLLEIRICEMKSGTDIAHFAQELNNHWNKLVQQIKESLMHETTEDKFAIYRFRMTLEHYQFAIDCFSEMLKRNGYRKMDTNNWFPFLQTIGVPIARKALKK